MQCGYGFCCALFDGGDLECWGSNQYYLNDIAGWDSISYPVMDFAVAKRSFCVLSESKEIECIGSGFSDSRWSIDSRFDASEVRLAQHGGFGEEHYCLYQDIGGEPLVQCMSICHHSVSLIYRARFLEWSCCE